MVQLVPAQSTPVPENWMGVLPALDLKIWVCWASLTARGIAKIKMAKKSRVIRLFLVNIEPEFIIIYVYIYIRGLGVSLST